jgi:hypothetical protein
LSDDQYVQAVSDLLPGVAVAAAPTPGRNPYEFVDTPGKLPVTGGLTPLLRGSAKSAARSAVENLGELVPCAAGETSQACATRFLDRFAPRAFRRPWLDGERERFLSLYAQGARGSHADGIRLVLEAVLQSPSLLYRVELGGGALPTTPEARKLSSHELASALSFFLLGSIPDEQLWQTALDGALARPEVHAAEVERLLALPRVQAHLSRVLLRWLKLERILVSERAVADFPGFQSLRQPMLDESRRFFSRLLTSSGTIGQLFTSRTAELDPPLARFYGLESAAETGLITAELPIEQRAGILTHASLIGSIKASNRSVHRGLFVFRELLCGVVPPPPPGIETEPPGMELHGERELAQYRASQATCGGCHGMFDGIGLSYEHYDALGQYRSVDTSGAAIDATASVLLDGKPITVGSVTELSELMAQSPQVRSCIARQLMSYAAGESASEECAAGVSRRVHDAGDSLLELFRGIATDAHFVTREVQP